MKFSRFFFVGGLMLSLSAVEAGSLYNTAPTVGLPESYPVRWKIGMSIGYDSNVNGVNASSRNYKSSIFSSYWVESSYSDQDKQTALAYKARIGGSLYTRNSGYGRSNKTLSNLALDFDMTHRFDSTLTYTTNNTISYHVDPHIDSSISANNLRGLVLTYITSHSLSKALDDRWSVSGNVRYSGISYDTDQFSYDDRQYISLSESVAYRHNSRLQYVGTLSEQFADRERGLDSKNLFANAGVNYSLSPISSCSFKVGAQLKMQNSMSDTLSPTLSAGYNRTVAGRTNVHAFVSYANEVGGTYYNNANYGDDFCWRMGVTVDHPLTHILSLNYGTAATFNRYGKGQRGLSTMRQQYYHIFGGLKLRHNANLSSSVRYTYSNGHYRYYGYSRNVVSYNLEYNF